MQRQSHRELCLHILQGLKGARARGHSPASDAELIAALGFQLQAGCEQMLGRLQYAVTSPGKLVRSCRLRHTQLSTRTICSMQISLWTRSRSSSTLRMQPQQAELAHLVSSVGKVDGAQNYVRMQV